MPCCRLCEHPESADARSKLEHLGRLIQGGWQYSVEYSNAATVFERHIKSICAGRWFFVTDTGLRGLTAGPVQMGDELVGLFGINLPFVLRRRGDEQGPNDRENEEKQQGFGPSYRMLTVAHVAQHQLGHGNSRTVRYHEVSREERNRVIGELGLREYRIK